MRWTRSARAYACPVAAVLVLASSRTAEPVLATGVVLAGLVTVAVVVSQASRRPVDAGGAP